MKPKYTVKVTNKFKKDYKLALKRNLPVKLLEYIVQKLANAEPLPPENRDLAHIVIFFKIPRRTLRGKRQIKIRLTNRAI